MKVPPHPSPASLIWPLTIWADCVEGSASLANIGTSFVASVFFKVISVAPPERQTNMRFVGAESRARASFRLLRIAGALEPQRDLETNFRIRDQSSAGHLARKRNGW
jgi:hypothetical protein